MTLTASPITRSANVKSTSARRAPFGLAVLALALLMSGSADARLRGAYDGTWNVVFTTKAGRCSSNNSAPFNVSGTHVSSAGGGKVTGGISSSGAVAVRISVGLSAANGTGRLVGNSGSGHWKGIISGDRCSGTWRASRT